MTANGERGQALLELWPVVILMLILAFAVIDIGRAIWQVEVITGLTREGSNLASRSSDGTLLQALTDAANSVVSDGAVLNLQGLNSSGSGNGKVIITSVQNLAGSCVITAQYSIGTLAAQSKVGTYSASPPAVGALPTPCASSTSTYTIPPLNGTVYVTEIYTSYSPITPLGVFVNWTLPPTLYDVAYF
jgi:Flp pilus assembly protein TadG